MVTTCAGAIVAVVHAPDGIRFVASGHSAEAVLRHIAGYVRGRCRHVLSPESGMQVSRLIAAGRPGAAISVYFDRVGECWDEEYLDLFTADGRPVHWTPDAGGLLDANARR